MKIELSFALPWKGLLLSVDANYYPATPDVPYLRNGDPGYPGDPEEVEFTITNISLDDWDSVKDALNKGSIIDLTSADLYYCIMEECIRIYNDYEERGYRGRRDVKE